MADGLAAHGVGNVFRKRETVTQVGVLHEAEDDGRLRVVGVEALVFGLVIVFQHDNGILSFDQVQILGIKVIAFALGLPQAVDGIAVGGGSLFYGINVDGNEQVGVRFIGKYRPVFQFYKDIFRTGHAYFYVRIGDRNFLGQALADVQRDVFLVGFAVPAYATGVLAAVSRVYHHGFQANIGSFLLGRHGDCKHKCGQKSGYIATYERHHAIWVLKIVE